MRVTITFDPYNTRRYGRPWIARVTDWPIGKSPVLEFGGLFGLTAEIEASPGAVVRWGQRDNRGNNTTARWGIVQVNGDVTRTTPEECREQWLAGCPVPPKEADDRGDNVVPIRGA
jgi:hypothetical protein